MPTVTLCIAKIIDISTLDFMLQFADDTPSISHKSSVGPEKLLALDVYLSTQNFRDIRCNQRSLSLQRTIKNCQIAKL